MDLTSYIDQLSDGNSLESLENLDTNTEHFVRMGLPMSEARRKAASMSIGSSKGVSVTGSNADKYGNAALFDITITRNTATIAAVLPVPVFGAIDQFGKYSQSLGGYLPDGVTLTSVVNTNGAFVFTYTDGTHTDTITITCSQIAYASFVNSTLSDVMAIRAIRYKINSDAQLSNFSNQFTIVKKSLYGAKKQDNIPVASYLSPNQFLRDTIDIGNVNEGRGNVTTLDKETSIVIGMNAAAFSITQSVFISAFNKLNAESRLS